MPDYPLVPLDQLNPVSTPSRNHVLAAMLAGGAGALTVSQILSLIESSDVDGFDEAIIDLIKASVAKTSLVDGDKFIGLDSENGLAPVQYTLTNLIGSIFKTARTIANAQFASATFKLFNAAGTPRALSFVTTALQADRTVTLPNRDVDFTKLGAYAVLQDQKASGTAGGGSVASAWTTRVLNTEVVDAANIVTLSGNQFTPAVDCRVAVVSPFYQTSITAIRIWNVTDGVEAARSANITPLNGFSGAPAVMHGFLAANKTYRVEYFCTAVRGVDGLGNALSSGAVEIYTSVLLEAVV